MSCIVILGAGAVGVNTALLLDAYGYEVVLVESGPDLLMGAPQVSFINHGDGLEYYKRGHLRTGQYCIDGAITKALLYPLSAICTDVCDQQNPIRFFLAQEAISSGAVSPHDFFENAEKLSRHFARKYGYIRAVRQWTDDQASAVFLRRPESFWRKLPTSSATDVHGVAAVCAGSSFGINMPQYYAFLKAALRNSRITCQFGLATERIEKSSDAYDVHVGGRRLRANHLLLCASHHIPALSAVIFGTDRQSHLNGTYYLNSMTFLTLPATQDSWIRASAKHINFTLQGSSGGMFACLLPPTSSRDGVAAIYFPSPSGSQRLKHTIRSGMLSSPPVEWDDLIQQGLPNDDRNVLCTFAQACRLYPFLDDYAHIRRTVCRTVFNTAVRGSRGGMDRRVREITMETGHLTSDGRVSAWAAPKWTNAELVALQAVDYVRSQTKQKPLPKNTHSGCGPNGLDVAKISESINFRDLRIRREDAIHYARQASLPEEMIHKDSTYFEDNNAGNLIVPEPASPQP